MRDLRATLPAAGLTAIALTFCQAASADTSKGAIPLLHPVWVAQNANAEVVPLLHPVFVAHKGAIPLQHPVWVAQGTVAEVVPLLHPVWVAAKAPAAENTLTVADN